MFDGASRVLKRTDGRIFKTLLVGFNDETKEEWVAMKDTVTGETWFMPYVNLKRKVLIKGVPTYVYADITDEKENTYGNNKNSYEHGKREHPYNGYTNDPRLDTMQRPNFRYSMKDSTAQLKEYRNLFQK